MMKKLVLMNMLLMSSMFVHSVDPEIEYLSVSQKSNYEKLKELIRGGTYSPERTEYALSLIDTLSQAELEQEDEHGHNLLIYALKNPALTITSTLISKFSIEALRKPAGKYGRTPLMWAIGYGPQEAVELLVPRLIAEDFKMQDNEGKTALMCAVERSNKKIVEVLLPYYDVSDLKVQDKRGKTALMYAIKNNYQDGYTDIVKSMLNSLTAEDVRTMTDIEGKTVLMYAVENNNLEIVKLLLPYVTHEYVQRHDEKGQSILLYGCDYLNDYTGKAHEEIIQLLVPYCTAKEFHALKVDSGVGYFGNCFLLFHSFCSPEFIELVLPYFSEQEIQKTFFNALGFLNYKDEKSKDRVAFILTKLMNTNLNYFEEEEKISLLSYALWLDDKDAVKKIIEVLSPESFIYKYFVVDVGCNALMNEKEYYTAYEYAQKYGCPEIVQMIKEKMEE